MCPISNGMWKLRLSVLKFLAAHVCMCIQLCPFPPTLSSYTVIDNRTKGEVAADKEAKCADQSIRGQKQRSVGWGGHGAEKVDLPETACLKAARSSLACWATLLPPNRCPLLPSVVSSLSSFSEGCLPFELRELIFLLLPSPTFFYLKPHCRRIPLIA